MAKFTDIFLGNNITNEFELKKIRILAKEILNMKLVNHLCNLVRNGVSVKIITNQNMATA